MRYQNIKEVKGIEDGSGVDVEVWLPAISVEITAFAQEPYHPTKIELNEHGINELIASLIEAKALINQNNACTTNTNVTR